MKFLFKILFFSLACFTNQVNATPVITKVVLPSYEFAFSKKENVKEKSTPVYINDGSLTLYSDGVGNGDWYKISPDGSHDIADKIPLKKCVECKDGVEMGKKTVNEAGNWQAIKNSIANRIAGKQGWTLKYTDNEIQEILTHGKVLNLPENEIEDIILNGCRPDKSFSKADLISQSNFWNIVKQRGYPNLFQSLQEYDQFSTVVKNLATEWNLPANSIYTQGSSLRMSNVADIGDLDIAIKVDAATFDNLANRFEEAATANFKKQAITDDKAKGILRGGNMHMKDVNGTFTANFYNKFKSSFNIEYSSKFANKGFQISIIKEGSSLDVSPYLKLK